MPTNLMDPLDPEHGSNLEPLDDGSLGHGGGEGGHLQLNRAHTRASGEAPAPQLHCAQHHLSDLKYIKYNKYRITDPDPRIHTSD